MEAAKERFLKTVRSTTNVHICDFMRLWYKFDKDRNGYLEEKNGELKNFLRELMSKAGKSKMVDVYLSEMMKFFDVNKDGKIELKEMAKIVDLEENFLEQFMMHESITNEQFDVVFSHYDKDGNGEIDGPEIIGLLRDLKATQDEEPTTTELEAYQKVVLESCDENGDGKVSKEELKLILVG